MYCIETRASGGKDQPIDIITFCLRGYKNWCVPSMHLPFQWTSAQSMF